MKRVYQKRKETTKTIVPDIESCESQPTTSSVIVKTEEENAMDLKKLRKSSDFSPTDDTSVVSKKSTVTISGRMAEQIQRIEQMRLTADAPVDTMGCHMLADRTADPKVYRFQILVGLMLSSQTKDQITSAAMERLKNYGLTIENIEQIPNPVLEKLLVPVSFYKRKAEYLKKVAVILKKSYHSDIPATLKELCDLPGVGPKMANLALQVAWEKVEGIGVDTHVHRIANRLGWIKTKTPIETEKHLTGILPRERWQTINKLLVGFGQQICLPVKPKCTECLNRDICPASTAKPKKSVS